jgi:hypothetical protein
MAETHEKTERLDQTVLVAWVTVHLESSTSFELLPFEDTEDVKRKVCDLMKAWAKSGFLIRGSEIYPWHRVQRIEATKVEEMSRADANLRRDEWQAKEMARMQQSFWKTKRARPEKENGEEGTGEQGGHPGMAA